MLLYYTEVKKGGFIVSASYGFGRGFALLVVLFILLIIVGAAYPIGYPGPMYGPVAGANYNPYC
ncbi:YjcZ family sporulation protein [Pseudalkalibacillus caeni]|uniref:YjcZ family sporulation protein n=1 Tax=Exobacillus caeni TaxID=2574798 RepID=A0A5R9F9R9_9BACL|nr:YjcZ family sporulation protein [Pseudalkalibacillus caeni]